MKLYQPSTIKEIKEKYGFKLTKSLGQNFLTDKFVVEDIIDGSNITEEDIVIEIGPGIGVITYEAAKIAKKVVAVEIDRNLIPILKETLDEFDNVEVVNEDILKINVNELIGDEKKVKIIGNLPYYITTPIIMKLLEDKVNAESITIMMQKEVADRIKAKPGTKTYGALSIAVQYYCTVEKITDVPRTCFVPNPNVDSEVLKLNILKEKPVKVIDEELFFKVVRASFNMRRKTLNNSLMGVEGTDKEIIKSALLSAGIDPIRRGETLSIEEFAKLADEMKKRGI